MTRQPSTREPRTPVRMRITGGIVDSFAPGMHSRDTSGYSILFGPNADLIVYAGTTCDNCEEDLASGWEPKGYRTKTDTMIVYREEFTKLGRKHMWTDEARFAVYEKIQ